MIFVDTNILYNTFFETELSSSARMIIESPVPFITSFIVLNELVFISTRKLAEKRYGVKNLYEFRKLIAEKGYEPFEKDIEMIFGLIEDRDISIVPDHQKVEEWRKTMVNYRLLPNDALIATTCKYFNLNKIATFDSDFDRVDFLEKVEVN